MSAEPVDAVNTEASVNPGRGTGDARAAPAFDSPPPELSAPAGARVPRPLVQGIALFALGLFAGMAWLQWWQSERVLEAAQGVARSHEVEATLHQLLSSLQDVESSERGYLLSGEAAFLAPFEAGLERLAELQSRLERLVSDHAQQANLAVANELIARRVALSRRDVSLRDSAGFEAARRAVIGGEGQRAMDRVRIAFADMHVRQEVLLEERAAVASKRRNQVRWAITLGTAGGIVLLSVVLRLLQREFAHRAKTVRVLAVREADLARFKRTLDQTLDCVFLFDARTLRFSFANRGASLLSGYTSEELLRMGPLDITPEFTESAFREKLLPLLEDRVPRLIFQTVHRRRDASEVAVEEYLQLVREPGQPDQFISIVRDIGERNALTRDLQRANRELTDFAHIVSHDLKAPLRGIGSLASWLAADYGDRLDDDGRAQLALMLGRVKRLNAMIDGILAYSRAGQAVDQPAAVNLALLVPDVIDMLAPPAHIRVTVETALPEIWIDPTKAGQVFQNLLSNAIKFMDKQSGEVRLSCLAEKDCWHFAVADNGPGIEEKYFDRIFTPFETLAPRDQVEGTGVGLALVKKIVELEGGRIWLESRLGVGTTFHFTLPLTGRTAAGGMTSG